jgi:EAL and modified HD-GYP domain-containing signal transduction protein
VLDRRGRVVAHELLFRDSAWATTAEFASPLAATANVLVSTISDLGGDSLLGGLPGFVNADPELEVVLHAQALTSMPLIFDLPQDMPVDPKRITRIERLRDAGFDLCLDDFEYRDRRSSLLPYTKFAKVDFRRFSAARLRKIARVLDEHSIQKIACRIESAKDQRIVEQQGWEWVQGYYFAHPERIACRKPSIRTSRLLLLLSKLDDESTAEEVAGQLRFVPHLTMNILSLANLVRRGAGERIESVQQAIVMIGQKRLRRWLHLLLFSSDDPNGCADPLCQASTTRSTIMESLARATHGRLNPDRAGLIGLLSLTPALLGLHPRRLCEKLSLDFAVEKALVHRKGDLGALLELVEQRETADFEGIERHLKNLDLSWTDLERSELEATRWLNDLSDLDTRTGPTARIG